MINPITITLGGTEYKAKLTIGAQDRFQKNHPESKIESGNLLDILVYVHCCMLAGGESITYTDLTDTLSPNDMQSILDAFKALVDEYMPTRATDEPGNQ